MGDLVRFLLSGPFSLVLAVLGLFLFAAFFFDKYFGFEPREKTRRIAGGLGVVLLVAGGGLWYWKPSGASTAVVLPEATAVDLSLLGTLMEPDHSAAAAPYLHKFGISITKAEPPGSAVTIANNLSLHLYHGGALYLTHGQNVLTQIGTRNAPATFTLEFSEELGSVTFTRPRLYAPTNSGVTHPAWSAHALDKKGRELSSHRETLTRSFSEVPRSQYTLRAPGFCSISAIRFDSDLRLDGEPFAAFPAILIDGLGFTPRPSDRKCDA